ncbi:MAG: Transcriptional repressor MprA [Chloroflexi bacterium]|nr:Transcriptional repressor MprA [Chloroflexota bacterium]
MSNPSKSFQEIVRSTLGKIHHLSMRNFWRFAKEQKFSIAQMITLKKVHHRRNTQGCSVSDISEWLGVTNAAVSQSLDKLVDQGLVERQENPQDRRSKQILLTSQGEEILKKSMRAQRSWIDDLATHLTPEEQAKIEDSFRLLTAKIADMEER